MKASRCSSFLVASFKNATTGRNFPGKFQRVQLSFCLKPISVLRPAQRCSISDTARILPLGLRGDLDICHVAGSRELRHLFATIA